MDFFWLAFRFVIGSALGSFLNVIALRYDPNRFLFARPVIGGRSHCPHCGRTLRWFELIPIISFLFQYGRCRNCHASLSPQYVIAELIAGGIAAAVPYVIQSVFFFNAQLLSLLWTGVLLILFLVALIDMRLNIIPDELVAILALFAIPITLLSKPLFGLATGSFVGHYALLLGFRMDIWANRGFAALVGSFFLLFLLVVTRGKGMGMGDVKLAVSLGFLFGWPDVLVIIGLAFVVGSVVAAFLMMRQRAGLKSAVPFGPFLATASLIIFFAGVPLFDFYFRLVGL